MLLRVFTEDDGIWQGRWIDTSVSVALTWGKASSYAQPLHKWCRAFIKDETSLPKNPYGAWNTSVLHMDEDLKAEIETYLQLKGKFVRAQDIVECVSQEHLMVHLQRQKPMSVQMARCWMRMRGYRWRKEPKGQYADGHESPEVIKYHQQAFLPARAELEKRMRKWDGEGKLVVETVEEALTTESGMHSILPTVQHRIVVWYHDESIFYAHDRHKIRWVHVSEMAKPYAKGEGQLYMISDFVSADYGWLCSADGQESARVELKPGKNCDGYFTNDEVLEQVTVAINLAHKLYPNDDHAIVFDNATTHSK